MLPRVEADESALQRLVDMGFDREESRRALVQAMNNYEAAVARLVEAA
jgi:uncharacterized UBP type Zn finger protein